MNWFTNLFEKRANPNAPASDYLYIPAGGTSFNVGTINEEKIMSIPSVAAAINLYAGVISSLPLEIHTLSQETNNFVLDEKNSLWDIISEFANDELTSVDWIQFLVRRALINGRSLSYIERTDGRISNIFPLDNTKTEIRILKDGTKRYVYKYGTKASQTFVPNEIIDIVWQLKPDTYSHVNPIKQHEGFFTKALLIEEYSRAVYEKGPLPPMVAYKKVDPAVANQQKASENAQKAVREALYNKGDGVPVLPDSLTLADIPYDPSKAQSLEASKDISAGASRIYNVPPSLLHDLSSGTFNNTEQQSQNFLKYSLQPWLGKIEKELNLKLLGRSSPKSCFIKFNTDHLIRGNFKDFIAAYATATDKGIITRDEVRYLLNLPLKGGAASELSMQKQFAPINDNSTDEYNNENGDKPINE